MRTFLFVSLQGRRQTSDNLSKQFIYWMAGPLGQEETGYMVHSSTFLLFFFFLQQKPQLKVLKAVWRPVIQKNISFAQTRKCDVDLQTFRSGLTHSSHSSLFSACREKRSRRKSKPLRSQAFPLTFIKEDTQGVKFCHLCGFSMKFFKGRLSELIQDLLFFTGNI